MYVPAHFDESRPEVLHALIKANPLGMLITNGAGGLDANHIPFELRVDEGPDVAKTTLLAHVARANPVWQDVANGDDVLIVFRAGDAYISPSWYPSKHETHKQVPTWNYRVVHAYGRVTIHDDERYVRGVVARLTRTHEAAEEKPWKMSDSAPEFIDTMLKAIVGIEIDVTRLVGKFKLSQNKAVQDIQGASDTLRERGESVISDAMQASAAAKEG